MKYLFVILFIAILVVLACGAIYLWAKFKRILTKGKKSKDMTRKERVRAGLLALIPVVLLALWCVLKPYVGSVAAFHFVVFWAIVDLVGFIVTKIAKTRRNDLLRLCIAVVVTTAYLCMGYYFAHHVYETDYKITTNKSVTPLRVAMIGDSHVGACFDGEGFAEHMKTLEACKPDLLIIAGDFVDDDTTRADMVRACKALGELETTYGVYYSMGNHDRGYSNYRDFTFDDLIAELQSNNVVVLRDEVMPLNDYYEIVGRIDKSEKRQPIDELMAITEDSKYTIVIDHQPNDYDAEAAAGCDLVLSGHTHGGQLIPIGPLGELVGANDATYGLERRGRTDFIVTSGIADWALPFKTGTISEFCIIDIE